MKHGLTGALFILHGLAHSEAAIAVAAPERSWLTTQIGMSAGAFEWLATAACMIAMVGFTAAGFGALGLPWMRNHWRSLAIVAAGGSIVLLSAVWGSYLIPGALIDIGITLALFNAERETRVAMSRSRMSKHHPVINLEGRR